MALEIDAVYEKGVLKLPRELPLEEGATVRITIHDVSGRLVATIADGDFPAGYHDAVWGGEAGEARPSSGVYFVRMTANDRQITRRLVMLPR